MWIAFHICKEFSSDGHHSFILKIRVLNIIFRRSLDSAPSWKYRWLSYAVIKPRKIRCRSYTFRRRALYYSRCCERIKSQRQILFVIMDLIWTLTYFFIFKGCVRSIKLCSASYDVELLRENSWENSRTREMHIFVFE